MADITLRLDPEIIIGTDTINRMGTLCSKRGRKILVATEQGNNDQIKRLIEILEDAGLETLLFDEIPAHATAESAEAMAFLAKGARCDVIVGLGGTNTQYIARLASVLTVSNYGLFDLFDGEREESSSLPYMAIPTAGEDPFLFSDNLLAVDPRDRIVKQIKCPRSLCQAVIVDSGLSENLNGEAASVAALDGLCAALEAYCSTKSSFLSDLFLEQAISLYSEMKHGVYSFHPGLLMSLGVSLSAPGIGTALAYSLSGRFPVAKSSCSAVLLPYVMEKLVACRPEKMARAAALMGEQTEGLSKGDAAKLAVDAVRSCMEQSSIPAQLKDFNLSLDKMVPVADAARDLEFVAFSPWTVASEDSYDLLKQAF